MILRFDSKLKWLLLFLLGGFIYGMMEIGSRGYSHISMFIAGGICFMLIDWVNHKLPQDVAMVSRMLVSALIITVVEFISGVIVNLVLDLHVWDYSTKPYNILGQVCLIYTLLWFGVSLLALFADDYISTHWFQEPKRVYKFF